MRYISQLSKDLSEITDITQKEIEGSLKTLIENKYKKFLGESPEELKNKEEDVEVENEEAEQQYELSSIRN